MDIIKLVSIPDELLIYKCPEYDGEKIKIENNGYIFYNFKYLLLQNLNLIKTS